MKSVSLNSTKQFLFIWQGLLCLVVGLEQESCPLDRPKPRRSCSGGATKARTEKGCGNKRPRSEDVRKFIWSIISCEALWFHGSKNLQNLWNLYWFSYKTQQSPYWLENSLAQLILLVLQILAAIWNILIFDLCKCKFFKGLNKISESDSQS